MDDFLDGPFIYGIVKFLAYSFWGYVGYKLYNPNRPYLFFKSIQLGTTRWILGLVIGIFLFFIVSPERENILQTYFLVYIPVRFLEWAIIGNIFYDDWPNRWHSLRFYFWIFAGILVSFLADLSSPDMIKEARFCVGRCLC